MSAKFPLHTRSFVWALGLALALSLTGLSVQAQSVPMTEVRLLPAPVGLGRGQSLRYTIFAPNGTPVRAHVEIYDEHGAIVARSAEVAIAAGEFRSVEFSRDTLPLAGEAGTGRAQVGHCICFRHEHTRPESAVSVELIDNATGKTLAATEASTAERFSGQYVLTSIAHTAVGVTPGEKLRVNVANPMGEREPAQAQVQLFDALGNLLAESAETTIPVGAFHSFDFNRSDLPSSGELGTGRVEVSVRYRSFFIVDRTRLQTSIELVNLATGFTTVWLPGKPKEIVVVGSSSK